MKIFNNLNAIIKLYSCLPLLKKHKIQILNARNSSDDTAEQQAILNAEQAWVNAFLNKTGIKVNVIGKENLPETGPVVFIANHQGYADIPALLAGIDNLQIGFIAKDDISKLPIYGKWLDLIRGLYIQRSDARAALKTINEGCNLLSRGFSLVIFPEGTRSQGPQMNSFKPGSFKLATKAKVPIVPITIDGTYKLYEESGLVKTGMINLIIHKAIFTKDLSRQELSDLPKIVFDIIKDGLEINRR